jgi:hypothetical protein
VVVAPLRRTSRRAARKFYWLAKQFLGMIERGGQMILRVLDNVRQVTIQPIIEKFIKPGTLINTDEYDIYCRLTE